MDPNAIWRLETEPWDGREGYVRKVLEFMEAEAERRATGVG
jgi:hypothetical protein